MQDSENELEPSSTLRSTSIRRRFTTKTPKANTNQAKIANEEKIVPTRKSKTLKATNSAFLDHRERFHAKFNNKSSTTIKPTITKSLRSFHTIKNNNALNEKRKNLSSQVKL